MTRQAEHVALEVFWKLHRGLPKQGPGSDASTRKALAMLPDLPDAPEILDLGCGPGRQTLVLARETGGRVTAIDLLPPFLEQLEERARAAGLADRIAARQQSMDDLPFPDEAFDLLWSEGAIYNIGFDHGLESWRRVLRPNGCLAVTDAAWLVDAPPRDIAAFWEKEYPAMRGRAANEQAVSRAGYTLLDDFVLPDSEWWDDYYTLIERRIATLREEDRGEAWTAALDTHKEEVRIVRENAGSFGYVFYVMQREET